MPIAIVGLAFGRYIIGCIGEAPAKRCFRLAAVCDIDRDLADEAATAHGVKAYYSLDEVLKDPAIRVIGLFTGPARRAELIRSIIRAGKDVLTTKPFELDAREAEAVLAEARELGRVIHLNSPGPEPTPEMAQISQWRDEHQLGRLVAARADVWASYFETADGTWLDLPDHCPGGPMIRLGIYLINDLIALTGAPEEIELKTSRIRTGRPTPDNALLTMCFPGGCLGSIYASFCVEDGDPYANGLSLQFERGSIYRNVGAARNLGGPDSERTLLSLVRLGPDGRRTVEERSFPECSGAYQWEALHEAVTQRRSISAEYAAHIAAGVTVLEAMRRSKEQAEDQLPHTHLM